MLLLLLLLLSVFTGPLLQSTTGRVGSPKGLQKGNLLKVCGAEFFMAQMPSLVTQPTASKHTSLISGYTWPKCMDMAIISCVHYY